MPTESTNIKRNECIIWYDDPVEGNVTICINDKNELMILTGLSAWLWKSLTVPLSLQQLKIMGNDDSQYASYCNDLESTVNSLIEREVFKEDVQLVIEANSSVPQKYKNKYTALLREFSAAKNFAQSRDLNAYHQNAINTADRHFEAKEITVSHLYREPHPALGNLSYGAKLYTRLNAIKPIRPGSVVVEVGGGLGYLARSFLQEYSLNHQGEKGVNYTFCDLTLTFVESQRTVNSQSSVHYCQANAEKIPLRDNSVDFMIANENIADFTAVKLSKKLVLAYLAGTVTAESIEDRLVAKSLEWIKLGGIDVSDAMPDFIFNLGAVEFIGEIKRVLTDDGIAFISEYGITGGYPTAVALDGHVEYSIQFSQLVKIIKALGMKVELVPLVDFLGFKREMEVVTKCSLNFLCGLLRKRRIEFPFLAYTLKMLEEKIPDWLPHIHNLKFTPIGCQSVCHNLNEFYVLIIFAAQK